MRAFDKKLITKLICTMALCLVVTVSAQPNLIANWTFNNTASDVTGNGFDAALRGQPSYIDDAAKGSYSLLLNGTTDYAYVGPMDLGDQFTICAWVYLEFDMTNIQTIFGNAGGGSTVDGFKLFVNNWETANHRILIESADGSTRIDAMTAEEVFEPGYWNHIAATLDRTTGITHIYYNGEEVTENGAIVTGFQTTGAVTIGAMSDPSWFWSGMIDDVRIYDGLLTTDEIVEVMNSPETGVEQRLAVQRPESFELKNYPNPFNPSTTLSFTMPQHGNVDLRILNVSGETVRTLVHEARPSGSYTITWNGLDDAGEKLPSGVYLAQLNSADEHAIHKMLLVK